MMKRKLFNQRGQTLVEMVVTTFIISVGLIAILTFFIVSRQGVTSSWRYTQKNELAGQVMEQLKATPYATLRNWEQIYRVGGQARDINPRTFVPPWDFGTEYQNYDIRIDLLAYKSYSLDQLMKVVVRVRETPSSPWLEKGSIIRMGE
jgi:hypothetical protein